MTVPHPVAEAIQQFAVWVIPLILSVTLHEAAHGYAALRLGDDTALRMGRISANPIVHIDPFGTILLPGLLLLTGGGSGFLFGWAKPVPVNFGRLKPLRLGMVLVALAGPGMNLLLAFFSALLVHLLPYLPPLFQTWAAQNLYNSVSINLVLAVFNLLPLPPLDGGRVLMGLLPRHLAIRLDGMERYTLMLLMLCLLVLPMVGLDIFQWVVGLPAHYLRQLLFHMTGVG